MPIKNRTHFKEEGNLPSDAGGIPLEIGILLDISSFLHHVVSAHMRSKLSDVVLHLVITSQRSPPGMIGFIFRPLCSAKDGCLGSSTHICLVLSLVFEVPPDESCYLGLICPSASDGSGTPSSQNKRRVRSVPKLLPLCPQISKSAVRTVLTSQQRKTLRTDFSSLSQLLHLKSQCLCIFFFIKKDLFP